MRALIQRVTEAAVWVVDEGPDDGRDDGRDEVAGRIGHGLVALVGVTHDDTEDEARRLAERIAHLRVLPDHDGVMNRSVLDAGAAVLVVSQFTLYADTRKGRRPSYVGAAPPEVAEPLVDAVADHLRGLGLEVAEGRFRTHMQVSLVNDGPVTVLLEV